MNKVHLTATLGTDVDINKVWSKIKGFKGISLGGRNSRYAIDFDGDPYDALKLIEIIEEQRDHEIKAHYESCNIF